MNLKMLTKRVKSLIIGRQMLVGFDPEFYRTTYS